MKSLEKGTHHFTDEERKALNREGYRVLVGGVLIHLVLGTYYLWGGISKYVASYLNSYNDTVTPKQMLSVFPYMSVCMMGTTSIGIKIAHKIGHKLLLIIAIGTIVATHFVCAFITNDTVFIIVYAGGFGISAGVAYMLPVECALKYFPQSKGKISGIIIAGFGMGSFIFNFVTLAIVNPNNEHPDEKTKLFNEDVYGNVPKMFIILAICFAVIGSAGIFLIKYPKDLHLELYDEHHALTKDNDKKSHQAHDDLSNQCSSLKEGITSRPFIFLFLLALFGTYTGYMMAGCYKTYGFDQGKPDNFLTLVGSLQSFTNGSSRALWGYILDKIGFKRTLELILIGQLALTATINYITEVDALFLIWICLIMGLEGGQVSIFPAICMKTFGYKVGSMVYGIMFNAFSLANLNSYFILNKEVDNIGWSGLWWIAFGYTVIAFILILIYNPEHQWPKRATSDHEYPIQVQVQSEHNNYEPHIDAHHDDDHHDDDHHDDDHHNDRRI